MLKSNLLSKEQSTWFDGVFLFPLNLCVTIDWISNNCFPCFATSAGMILTLSYLNSRSNFTWKSSYLYVSKFSIVYKSSPTSLLLPQKISFCLLKNTSQGPKKIESFQRHNSQSYFAISKMIPSIKSPPTQNGEYPINVHHFV